MTLNEIGLKHRTDKASSGHDFLKHYETYLAPWRHEPITLLEVGVGGYQFPDRGGESLRMWYEYFTRANIVGIDVYDKAGIMNDRTKFYKGSQTDEGFLKGVVSTEGRPMVIIDDASHINSFTIKTFEILFWELAPGGIYIYEDTHTSYWQRDYGGSPEPNAPGTSISFLKNLVDTLQFDSVAEPFVNTYPAVKYRGYIEFIHFYRNTCIIKKLAV